MTIEKLKLLSGDLSRYYLINRDIECARGSFDAAVYTAITKNYDDLLESFKNQVIERLSIELSEIKANIEKA